MVVQGVGGALIMANSGAVTADRYPREQRGRLHAAFYESVGFMVIGAILSAVRGSPARR